jgi:hypothetical protein
MNALSGERFKLTDAQIRPQLKKAAEFCNTIGGEADVSRTSLKDRV